MLGRRRGGKALGQLVRNLPLGGKGEKAEGGVLGGTPNLSSSSSSLLASDLMHLLHLVGFGLRKLRTISLARDCCISRADIFFSNLNNSYFTNLCHRETIGPIDVTLEDIGGQMLVAGDWESFPGLLLSPSLVSSSFLPPPPPPQHTPPPSHPRGCAWADRIGVLVSLRNYLIAFWVPSNRAALMAICRVLWSHDCTF